MKQKVLLVVSAIVLAILPYHANAQADSAELSAINVPDVSKTPDSKTVKTGYKFFFFHRVDTTFDEALRDLTFCTQFSRRTSYDFYIFVPWGEPDRRPTPKAQSSNFGIVGDVIGAMISASLDRGEYVTRMRRCMELRDYDRYPMTNDAWNLVHPKDDRASLLMQAKLASGPQPTYAKARR